MFKEAAESAGMILLITGAGGAYAAVVNQSGIGNYLVETLASLHLSLLFTGFILAAILRAALGSSTVALVTASSILGPLTAGSGYSPVLVGLAVCAGGMCFSLPNDSGFWVVSRFSGLSVKETLQSWTVGSSLGGVIAFIVLLVLNQLFF
jgi:GntP family gluconate:H+ symporter